MAVLLGNCSARWPRLNLEAPGDKPGRSTWIYFHKADGFEGCKGTVVVAYKAERGQADLQFAATLEAELRRRCEGLLDPTMQVVSAAKSASIRVTVPAIDFASAPIPQEAQLIEGFAACERLRALFVENRRVLLRV